MPGGVNIHFPVIDLAGIFLRAKESRERAGLLRLQEQQMQQQIERQQYENERQQLLPEAIQGYREGRPQMLQEIAPQEFKQLEGERHQQMQAQAQAADIRAKRTAQVLQQFTQMAPQQQEQVRPYLQRLAQAGQIDLPDFEQVQVQAPIQAALHGVPQAKDKAPLSDIGKKVADAGLAPGTPAFHKMVRDAMQRGDTGDAGAALRKEFQSLPVFKDTQQMSASIEKVIGASDNAAGDMALTFGYMKLLDPTSVVREGEQAQVADAGSVPARIVALFNRTVTGERLHPTVRAQFKAEAEKIYAPQLRQFQRVADQYRALAQDAGYDPSKVVFDKWLPESVLRKAHELARQESSRQESSQQEQTQKPPDHPINRLIAQGMTRAQAIEAYRQQQQQVQQ